LLGDHRILSMPHNPEARGKIEAYHRTLGMWFFDRLAKQVVIDFGHLQQLLDGVIYGLYQPHKHRGIKVPPAVALNGRVSTRIVPPTRLVEAFRQERRLKTHPKTGEVDLNGTTYLVPDELRGQKLTFLLDPPGEAPPMVQHPTSGKALALHRAAVKPGDLDHVTITIEPEPRWGHGNLQAIYDNWQGRRRPLAEPGFGLPEIYTLLAEVSGRFVPQSDAEAALIQDAYRSIGPLPQAATQDALRAIAQELGPMRPIKTYLDALIARARNTANKQRT
jgi:putative transposase